MTGEIMVKQKMRVGQKKRSLERVTMEMVEVKKHVIYQLFNDHYVLILWLFLGYLLRRHLFAALCGSFYNIQKYFLILKVVAVAVHLVNHEEEEEAEADSIEVTYFSSEHGVDFG